MKFKLVEEILNEEDELIDKFNSNKNIAGHYNSELDLIVFTKEEMEDWD